MFTSRVVLTGETKIVCLIEVRVLGKLAVRGFVTFIRVDLEGKPLPHGLNFEPQTEEQQALYSEVLSLH